MTTDTVARARGTIIKVPDASPGLLIVDGQQVPFTLEGRWKSPVAPAANMVVEVDLAGGTPLSIAAVDPQQLAKEKLDQLSGLAQQHGKEAAAMARQGIGALAARMGTASLVATVALWVAWFLLPAVGIEFLFVSRSFTWWQVLGLNEAALSNPSASSHGPFALLGLLAIAAPFATPFIQHPRARLLNAAPLAYLAATIVSFAWRIASALDGPAGRSELARGVAREMASVAWNAVSIGAGAYVLIAASAFLAYQAYRSKG